MILGEGSDFMADESNNHNQYTDQYNHGEECYSDLGYVDRQINKQIDLNNNDLNCNQQSTQQSNRQSNQHSNQQHQQINRQQSNSQQQQQQQQHFNQQQANHLNLVQFVDQFNNFSCNSSSLLPNLASNQQQLLCSNNQSKDLNSSNLANNNQIKIKSENVIDAIDLSNANLQNSSSNLQTNESSANNLANMNIPLLPSSINLNSINLANCNVTDQSSKGLLANGNNSNNLQVTLSGNLPMNLPANFNELLLNDYQLNPNQQNNSQLNSNLINSQPHKNLLPNNGLDQSNKINSNNNELSPIDMEDQEKIKLERKRMRNRIAASKCRRKKMETLQSLEDMVRQLKNENANLMRIIQDLKEMNCQVRQEVVEHLKRGCNIKTNL